ncbi:unnamed protein product [Thelazia callipaeda]|uniref:Protein quiver n=1 Tax=Thelazia callipaeda TaxID=103827 RepID=A0A0N5DCD1_THECL|nr:unnamed protein product [Thelazia callipaeda]
MNVAMGCTIGRRIKGTGLYHCKYRNPICPSESNFVEDDVFIVCCCEGYHLCNHDMTVYHAINRFPEFLQNPLCSQPSAFRFVFLPKTYPYCAVHYDYVLKKVVFLQTYLNMDLLREQDHKAYEQEGCQFIETKPQLNIPYDCNDDLYKREDTSIGRITYLCTCAGKPLSESYYAICT